MVTSTKGLPSTLAFCLLGALLAVFAVGSVQAEGLAQAGGSAQAASAVVGPGESIQKAINAADPGDTIVVRGVHREDVVIRKDGISLRGEDAVIEPPARADSPCSRAFGPEAICVLGDVNLDTFEVNKRVRDVSVTGFTIRGFKEEGQGDEAAFAIDVTGARDATVARNRTIGNAAGGIVVSVSIDTTVLDNDVIGNPKSGASGIFVEEAHNTTVVKNVVKSYPEGENAIEVADGINTTIVENDLIGNWSGAFSVNSTGTKILSNVMSRSGILGVFVAGPKPANAKVAGNDISGGAWGIYVSDTHGGSIAGNNVHDNCAGMFFEAFKSQPVGGFGVSGNTVENNTRSCRGANFGRKFSGIGIALLGASDMQLKGNHLSGNVPSGPTAVSGGVVVSTDPYFRGTTFGGTQKPRNNSVTGNTFGPNKPDIFWDKSGSGNRFVGNDCDKSVPARLCD
jgi:parallel beta-helix repeat protein